MERKHQVIESLLAKPTKKPDFGAMPGMSDVLKRAQMFMPKFIQTTDRLLADPELLKEHQMDIKVVDQYLDEQEDEMMMQDHEGKLITMDIGVGVYDVLNEDFNPDHFKPSSMQPIVRVKGMPDDMIDENESSSDDSDDSNLFYEFNSDSEVGSHTTKATNQTDKYRPMIIDITQEEVEQTKETLNNKNKKSKKRQRKN